MLIDIGWSRFMALALASSFAWACDSADVKQCRADYLTTYAIVQSVKSDDPKAVDAALLAVNSTFALCERAKLAEELKQLKGVRTTLEGMADYLKQYGNRKELTEAELEELVKKGDPGCPKGQAYKYRKTDKQVSCKGPQLVTMNWPQAEKYYEGRGFNIKKNGKKLRVEYGSESYTFHFAKESDPKPARCIHVFAAPGIPWEESVARFTGARPITLKKGKPVKTKTAGTMEISHTADETQAIYQLGECQE